MDITERALWTLLILFPATILFLALSHSDYFIVKAECMQEKTIVEVGGCTRHWCGVKYDDNTTDHVGAAVVGEKVCVAEEYRLNLPLGM